MMNTRCQNSYSSIRRYFMAGMVRKKRAYAVLLTLLLCWLMWYMFSRYAQNKAQSKWIRDRRQLMRSYFVRHTKIRNISKEMPSCVIPKLNAFSEDILHFMGHRELKCSVVKYGKVDINGVLVIKSPYETFSNIQIYYIHRDNPQNKHMNADFHTKLSKPIELEKGVFQYELEEDFVKIEMYVNSSLHVEYHAHISKKTQQQTNKKTLPRKTFYDGLEVAGLGFDVAFLMVDSQSNANFERQLLKTMPLLVNDEDTVILNGHAIVGDGTTAQIVGMFIGEQEEDLAETRRGFNNSGHVDQYNFIFKDLHKAGYATMFSEEDPGLNSFHYRLNGFRDPPTSWYLRPYWLGMQEKYHAKCTVEESSRLLKRFTRIYEDVPKVSLTINAKIAHDDLNMLQTVDDELFDMINFFKQPARVDHTVFVIFGDHGARAANFRATTQGKLEERLPFFSITLPPAFKHKHREMFQALKKNADILTSHFDVYATLKHILQYPNFENKGFIGQSLFTDISMARTCKSAGIKDHWCPCMDYMRVSTGNPNVVKVAKAVVEFINNNVASVRLASKLCSKLTLYDIKDASVRKPKREVSQFVNTKKNKECDSCEIVYDHSARVTLYYEVIIVVMPSSAIYEANASVAPDGSVSVDVNISRVNIYGNQPYCVMANYPHLRPYCYCKKKLAYIFTKSP